MMEREMLGEREREREREGDAIVLHPVLVILSI